jgi:hypothetical protein
MPYLVLNTEEMSAKAGEVQDRSYSDMLGAALNTMEDGGYALVAVEPPNGDGGGTSYIFHRPQPEQRLDI